MVLGLKKLYKWLTEHWLLMASILLLVVMSLPIIYFEGLQAEIDFQPGNLNNFRNTGRFEVGVCLNKLDETRRIEEKQILRQTAVEQGLRIKIEVANGSPGRQLRQFTILLNQGAKVMIVTPVNAAIFQQLMVLAQSRHVPLLLYDEPVATRGAAWYLGFDYRKVGRLEARAAFAKVGAGNYLIFKGKTDGSKSVALYQGQYEELKIRRHKGVKIISCEPLYLHPAQEAVVRVKQVLTRQPVHAILAPDDLTAEELIKYFHNQHLPLPQITGAGAELSACKRILNHDQLMTVFLDYPRLARETMLIASRAVKAGRLPLNPKGGPDFFPVSSITSTNLQDKLVNEFKLYSLSDLESQ